MFNHFFKCLKSNENLKTKELIPNCIICTDLMINSKTLQCGHRFCCDCIKQLYHYEPEHTRCPLCRKIINKSRKLVVWLFKNNCQNK